MTSTLYPWLRTTYPGRAACNAATRLVRKQSRFQLVSPRRPDEVPLFRYHLFVRITRRCWRRREQQKHTLCESSTDRGPESWNYFLSSSSDQKMHRGKYRNG